MMSDRLSVLQFIGAAVSELLVEASSLRIGTCQCIMDNKPTKYNFVGATPLASCGAP